jgi:protein tyrosine phosphatase (PTP) superfamily phosphohydrolase (DUF442 family)
MRHMDAENTYQVNDGLWTSGQLSERDIAQLPSLEIEAVINLAMPTSSNALRGEAELITVQGINYFHIPVVWEAPQLEELQTFFAILDALKGKKVWVHCAKNMRVSAFIYLYRKLCLHEPEELAMFPMQVVWAPNETWQKFIDDALVSKPGVSRAH